MAATLRVWLANDDVLQARLRADVAERDAFLAELAELRECICAEAPPLPTPSTSAANAPAVLHYAEPMQPAPVAPPPHRTAEPYTRVALAPMPAPLPVPKAAPTNREAPLKQRRASQREVKTFGFQHAAEPSTPKPSVLVQVAPAVPPSNAAGGGHDDLMAAIRAGKSLRKVPPTAPKASSDPNAPGGGGSLREDLMAAIRKGTNLRKVPKTSAARPQLMSASPHDHLMAAIKLRRRESSISSAKPAAPKGPATPPACSSAAFSSSSRSRQPPPSPPKPVAPKPTGGTPPASAARGARSGAHLRRISSVGHSRAGARKSLNFSCSDIGDDRASPPPPPTRSSRRVVGVPPPPPKGPPPLPKAPPRKPRPAQGGPIKVKTIA